MTNASRTPEQEAEIRLRKTLRHLAGQASVAGVKAALALAHWDGLDVPTKVLETINSMDKQETMSGRETADNQ